MGQAPQDLTRGLNATPGGRLILADWLEEHGQTERADLLRSGDHDTAEMPRDGYGDGDGSGYDSGYGDGDGSGDGSGSGYGSGDG